jgi:predicted naringenin-chalcone synthase
VLESRTPKRQIGLLVTARTVPGLHLSPTEAGEREITLISKLVEKTDNTMLEMSQLVSLCEGALNRPELRFSELLVPWIVIVGALGFLMAWLVAAIMEHTGLSRYVWHLPLFFVGLVVLFSSLIGMVVFP